MKLINGFFKLIGFNALLGFFVLLLLDYEETSIIFLVLALASFVGLLFLQLYKIYLVNEIKKNKTKSDQ